MKLLVCFFLLPLFSMAQHQEYDVFLLIGQSNMAGRGTMIESDTTDVIPNVFLLNDKGEVEPAQNPLNKYSTIRKGLKMQQINLGYSFSQKVTKETGRKILLVVNARGGSSINSWIKGANDGYFEQAIIRAKQAMQYGTLKAILWHQGESDSSIPETYEAKFKLMIDSMRKELCNLTLPVVIGEIAQWHGNAAQMNPMLNEIPAHVDNCYCISSKCATPLIDEKDPHFSRDGQLLLGQRYADEVLKVCYKK